MYSIYFNTLAESLKKHLGVGTTLFRRVSKGLEVLRIKDLEVFRRVEKGC